MISSRHSLRRFVIMIMPDIYQSKGLYSPINDPKNTRPAQMSPSEDFTLHSILGHPVRAWWNISRSSKVSLAPKPEYRYKKSKPPTQ